MRIHRGYLFWGIVFVLLGGIPLAERAGLIDADRLPEVGRLWPVVLVAIGVAIVVARTRLSLLGTAAAALVIGGLAGSALAYGSGWALDITDCTGGRDTGSLERTSHRGTFTGPASLELTLNCGELDLQAGALTTSLVGWSLDARTRDAAPEIMATDTSLVVRSPESTARRQEWTLFVPREDLASIAVVANAASADVDVTGALLQSLSLQLNAADARVIATDADIASLALEANAARARITAGGDSTILIEANASSVELCVPTSASVTVVVDDGFALVTNLDDRGLTQDGATWQRAGTTGGATILVQLQGNASTFTLDPVGGCA